MACGLGIVWQSDIREMWGSLISDAVEVPKEGRHQVMFGPEGTYDPAVRAASNNDSHPMAMPELIDAVAWGERMPDVDAHRAAYAHHLATAAFLEECLLS